MLLSADSYLRSYLHMSNGSFSLFRVAQLMQRGHKILRIPPLGREILDEYPFHMEGFKGRVCVDWIVRYISVIQSRHAAIMLGRKMFSVGVIKHIEGRIGFQDSEIIFQFDRDRIEKETPRMCDSLSDTLTVPNLMKILGRLKRECRKGRITSHSSHSETTKHHSGSDQTLSSDSVTHAESQHQSVLTSLSSPHSAGMFPHKLLSSFPLSNSHSHIFVRHLLPVGGTVFGE
jgi:hypothetical protein